MTNPDDPDADFIEATVACQHEGCENYAVDLVLLVSADSATRRVVCGPCGSEVTEVIPS